MGSGASIPERIDHQAFEELAGDVYPAHLFHRYCSPDGILRKEDLLHLSKQRDVYISFDPSITQPKHFERIQRMNDILRSKNVLTYFHDFPNSSSSDSHLSIIGTSAKPKPSSSSSCLNTRNVMSPLNSRKSLMEDLQQSICSAIDQSQVVVVCITKSYIQKVEGINGKETAKIEFGYSCRRKGFDKIIPVILEEELVHPSKWTGPVGLALRKHCGIPILQDDQLIDQVEQLYNQIVGISTPILLQSPRAPPSLSEPQVEVTVPPITPSTVADAPRITEESSPLDNTGSNTILSLKSSSGSQRMKFPPRLEVCIECPEYNALRNWLVEHINLEDDKARFLANKLISNGLQSPIRLKKRIELDSTYLATLGFNKEEVGNIIHAFAKQRKSSQRELTTVLDANVWNDDDDDHTTTSVTSSNRAELSTNGCLRCSEPIFRLPRGTFSTGWTCDWPTHEGENFFDAEDALHGCGNILQCNVGVCKSCYDRIQAGKDQYVTFADVNCNMCGLGMFPYPKCFSEKYGIPWMCASSNHPVEQNPITEKDVQLYGCASVGSCRSAMCQHCFGREVNRIEEEDEEE